MQRACLIGNIRNEDGEQLAIGDDIPPFEISRLPAGASFSKREQAAQSRIGGPIGRIKSTMMPSASRGGSRRRGGRRWPSPPRKPARCRRETVDDAERLDAPAGGRATSSQLLAPRRNEKWLVT